MKKLLPVIIFVVAYFGWFQLDGSNTPSGAARSTENSPVSAYSEWRSGEQVQGKGVVTRVLADDNDGSRHQRFIVKLETGQTLLVAHNIDLAPRVPSLRTGDDVAFNGQYESNDQGGVIHWTHKDPQRRHVSGWIKHNGKVYQ